MQVDKFLNLLNDHYEWPAPYTFKFIVKEEGKEAFLSQFSQDQMKTNPSRTGKYTSYTFTRTMDSGEEIVQVYQDVAKIEGVLTL